MRQRPKKPRRRNHVARKHKLHDQQTSALWRAKECLTRAGAWMKQSLQALQQYQSLRLTDEHQGVDEDPVCALIEELESATALYREACAALKKMHGDLLKKPRRGMQMMTRKEPSDHSEIAAVLAA